MKSKKALGPVEFTGRGFEKICFTDASKIGCSLQMSSLAFQPEPGSSAIWLGCEEPNPKQFVPDQGWQPVTLPSKTLCTTRAHLTRDQVEALITHLQNWLEHNTFQLPGTEGSPTGHCTAASVTEES